MYDKVETIIVFDNNSWKYNHLRIYAYIFFRLNFVDKVCIIEPVSFIRFIEMVAMIMVVIGLFVMISDLYKRYKKLGFKSISMH